MNNETPEEIKSQRDALLSLEGKAQKREQEALRAIDILIAGEFVTADQVEQARQLAQLK